MLANQKDFVTSISEGYRPKGDFIYQLLRQKIERADQEKTTEKAQDERRELERTKTEA